MLWVRLFLPAHILAQTHQTERLLRISMYGNYVLIKN